MTNAISNNTTQAAPANDMEKKVRGFIEAVLLTKPDMKDRLSIAACVNYLQLPDTTFGWDAYKEQGKPMPIEYKFACLLPTLINDLSPGDICWLGNRPYAKGSAYETAAEKKLRAISGIKFRKLSDDEKEVYAIGAGDMAVIAYQTVQLNGAPIEIEGLGIVGADESQPNSKGNFKVARELTRDRAQFLRTRAIRDMRRRIITIGAVPFEDDYKAPEVNETAKHDPQKIIEIHNDKKQIPTNNEAETQALNEVYLDRLKTIAAMGGSAYHIIPDGVDEITVMIALADDWIKANTPPPEPPPEKAKPKREKKSKSEALVVNVDPAAPNGDHSVTAIYDPAKQTIVHSFIDENYTPDEIQNIVESEPHLDFDIPEVDDYDPIYEGTEEQKAAILEAAVAVGIPKEQQFLSGLSAAMRGQPMSKLPIKAAALRKGISDKTLAAASPKPASQVAPRVKSAGLPPTPDQREKLRNLMTKMVGIGLEVGEILNHPEPWDIWELGNSNEISLATVKLEAAYKKHLMGVKK